MADVFISYAREDRSRAEQVARALQAAGIEAFWDTDIPPGQTWADYIEAKLSAAKALIVLWSAHSTKSQWVREEARMGRDKNKLIPIMLDASPAPFGFGEVQAADLSHWNGDAGDAQWRRVQAAVEHALNRPAAPPPVLQPPPPAPPPPMAQAFAGFQTSAPGGETSPWQYVQKCLRLYVEGKGRARRSEFWWFAVFTFVVTVIAVTADSESFPRDYVTGLPSMMPVTTLAMLALIAPSVAVTSRRLHDIGLNGWWAAAGWVLAPFYLGMIAILVVGFVPGHGAENKYGPNPKAG